MREPETDLSLAEVWQVLDQVKDPEIPVVSVVEMGLIRSVGWEGRKLLVTMTPTFVGCPALQVMQQEIKARLLSRGVEQVEVRLVYSPPWSSDWIMTSARQKLRDFGLAPPPFIKGSDLDEVIQVAICPYCGSADTELANSFGPTLCRAIYICKNCRQPFEQFKPI